MDDSGHPDSGVVAVDSFFRISHQFCLRIFYVSSMHNLCIDDSLMMQLGAESVFVGSGIFKSADPESRANEIVKDTTYYKDWNGNTVNTWSHSTGAASMPYFFPSPEGGVENALLYYPCRSNNPTMETGGVGGRVDILNWDGDILYRYNISSTLNQHHHDIAVLPNGNFIVVAWERLYANEWQALGRTSVNNNLNQMWGTAFYEIQPTLDGRTESIDNFDAVVWEWHITDHLIQDVDPSLDNYGVI